ncbi:sigma-70 family RNA polymerase sigma factor [Agrobacterium sp.]|uniref:sigma-70 family RNA polymerase sigma factor n=1 Tax=Agrobacterium sp. TaxID=361 RepID=UPI0028AE19B2|nr:sigma-70 family RNA polymerase sigma factor [Agrobacterium sp.]
MKERAADGGQHDFETLMQAISVHRDIHAYEIVFRHFAPRVRSYMAKLAADSQSAEELMQETMIAVWNKADRYDRSKGSLSTWIFTIARNLRIDAVRKEKRPEFDPDDPVFVPDAEPSADTVLVAQQSADQLKTALAELPQEQAKLLEMSFFEDATHSVIAQQLNIPLGTVKSRMRLAFAKLRLALGKGDDA